MPVRLVTWMGSGIVLAGLALAGVTDRAPRHDPPHQAIWREAGDVSVRAVEAGTGPPTIVLLHGFGEHLLTWRGILDPLAVDARVVALDLPGFGGSDKPAGPWSVEAMTDRVIAFLAAWTEPPVTLVGHSMGGQIGRGSPVSRTA
jgi:pimeloyl-ACP methyl ester carboxylesterase